MIVIGTAGHIDHGKSSIVRRLTGTDPDRLPEEKARGMTIDLGFAFYRTSDGHDLAFVDVPGHERFVKNMIAGAGGIDVVMMVIAADDGWMPQSQEHFQIVKLLGVKTGVIILNKIDLAEPDWLILLESDVRARVQASFLAHAPIFRVSAQTGAGFEPLRSYLDALPKTFESRKNIGKARLYIDRSFVRQGIGGVVTGTLRGGSLSVGQSLSVWPSLSVGKVRSLQTHNDDVAEVGPGHRTAVSLSGVDKNELLRGGVISDCLDLSYLKGHQVFALHVEMLAEAPVSLEDRRRALLILGTTEVEGEIRMFDRTEIRPAENAIVFFRPDEPLYGLVGDRFIVRLPTPAVTLGGGILLDHLDHFPRRRELENMTYLRARTSGSLRDLLISELQKHPLVPEEELLSYADFSSEQIRAELSSLIGSRIADRFRSWAYHVDHLRTEMNLFKGAYMDFLKGQPHLKGLTIEQMCDLSHHSASITDVLIKRMLADNEFVKIGDKYNLAGRDMSLKGVVKDAHVKIMAALREQPFTPPTLALLASGGKPFQEAIRYVIESGEGYKCGSDFIFLYDTWNEILKFVREKLTGDNKMTVTDLKNRFGITRKYAIPILEETDRLKLTRREGDFRVKGDRFESESSVL